MGKQSLLERIKGADTTRPGPACSVCKWIAAFPPADADEWREVLALPTEQIGHTQVVAFIRQEFGSCPFTSNTLGHHRRWHP